MRFSLALQCAAMGALAGILAITVSLRLTSLHLVLPAAVATGALVAALSTVALGRNLIVDVPRVAEALDKLSRGSSLDSIRGQWPLAQMFRRLRALELQLGSPDSRERILRQVGEQAAADTRAKLAQDLHDTLKQQLFSITMSTAAAQARWEIDPAAARLAVEDAQRSARQAQVEMSVLLQDLRPVPLDGAGLVESLSEQCEALQYRTGAEVTLDVRRAPQDYTSFPEGIQESLLRIAQESLANVARHARAAHVSLRLVEAAGAVELEVRDDGQGFSPSYNTPGTGLAGIRERAMNLAGHAEIESSKREGTVIRVSIPALQRASSAERHGEPPGELESTIEVGRNVHYQTEDAAKVAALLILLGIPIWLAALSMPILLFGYIRGLWASTRTRQLAGISSAAAREQRYLTLDTSTSFFLFLALFLWYLPVAFRGRVPASTLSAVTCGVVLVVLVLAALQLARTYHMLDLWQALLPRSEQQAEIRARWQRITSLFTVWLIVVVLAALLGGPLHLAFPPLTPGEWSDDIGLAILVLWPLLIGIDALSVVFRQRQVPR